jgi:hypothetical protein
MAQAKKDSIVALSGTAVMRKRIACERNCSQLARKHWPDRPLRPAHESFSFRHFGVLSAEAGMREYRL